MLQHRNESVPDTYEDYVAMCQTADVLPMPESDWKAYQEYLSSVPNPVNLETYSRFEKTSDVDSEQVRLLQAECAELKQLLKESEARHASLVEVLNQQKEWNQPRATPANQPLYPHYFVPCPTNTTHLDISWVLKAWTVPCCEGHAIKKLMAAGKRGAKDRLKDLKEARDSISRAIELEETK